MHEKVLGKVSSIMNGEDKSQNGYMLAILAKSNVESDKLFKIIKKNYNIDTCDWKVRFELIEFMGNKSATEVVLKTLVSAFMKYLVFK